MKLADDHSNYIEWIFEKLFEILLWMAFIWLICWASSKFLINHEPKDIKPFFKTDPNKPVTEIKSLNYNTGEVTYRTYGSPSREYNTNKGINSYTILSTPSGEIKLNLTPAEIIQQLDIDYHDIRDYYGDELR